MMRQGREEDGTHFLAVLGFAFFKGAWAMVCVYYQMPGMVY